MVDVEGFVRPSLEGVDLGENESVGLPMWMQNDFEREALRTALTFDLLRIADNALHIWSEDPLLIHQSLTGPSTNERWTIPRPPMVEILDDWEDFLKSREPFEKTYSWDLSAPIAQGTGGSAFHATDWEASPEIAAVTLRFLFDDRDRPIAASDLVDREGQDRLAYLFAYRPFGHDKVAALLAERDAPSLWSSLTVFRCNANEARVWTDDDSDDDDFVVLSRSQFEAMIHDFINFTNDRTPYTKTYPGD